MMPRCTSKMPCCTSKMPCCTSMMPRCTSVMPRCIIDVQRSIGDVDQARFDLQRATPSLLESPQGSVLLAALHPHPHEKVLQDARGQAPDLAFADVVDAEVALDAVEADGALFDELRVGEGGEGEAEDLGDLGGVRLGLEGERDRSDTGDDAEAGRGLPFIQLTET